ncbi:MAG: F0F1 ATP synthase subunit B [Pirellula sp.]|nr:F0F1 ATP synthase subunit B [Pirellula sp.]
MNLKVSPTLLSFFVALMLFGFAGSAFAFEGGGGHSDPANGFASADSESLLEFRSDKAIFTVVVFLLLCAGLYFAAWKPISQGLARRESMIANAIEDAQKASEQAAVKLKEYEAKLADAAVQAQELVNQAKRDAESVAERIKADATASATRTIERAKAEIETAKQAALSELSTKSTDLAFGLARKVIGRELQAGDHQRLINEALGRLPSDN